MRLDQVQRGESKRTPCPAWELATALAFIVLAKCFVESFATESCCFGAFFFAIFLGPVLLPLAWLVWYGQPGPRSSDLRRSR